MIIIISIFVFLLLLLLLVSFIPTLVVADVCCSVHFTNYYATWIDGQYVQPR